MIQINPEYSSTSDNFSNLYVSSSYRFAPVNKKESRVNHAELDEIDSVCVWKQPPENRGTLAM